MAELSEVVRARHSTRVAFDPDHAIFPRDLGALLDAARWAPTPHNMQNFEILAVDDPNQFARIGALTSTVSLAFPRENDEQVSQSDEVLSTRQTGISGQGSAPTSLDPQAWADPDRAAQFTRSPGDPSTDARYSSCSCATLRGHPGARGRRARMDEPRLGPGEPVAHRAAPRSRMPGAGEPGRRDRGFRHQAPAGRSRPSPVSLGWQFGYPSHEVAHTPRVRRVASRWAPDCATPLTIEP
ncbi:MAG: nitroreductase family protein [Acidimicrobiales bacterium]